MPKGITDDLYSYLWPSEQRLWAELAEAPAVALDSLRVQAVLRKLAVARAAGEDVAKERDEARRELRQSQAAECRWAMDNASQRRDIVTLLRERDELRARLLGQKGE